MRLSHLVTKTRRDAPKDETSKNAQLLIRAGFIHKEMAGVYAYLPLGLRVIDKIKAIVRQEMNGVGGQEIIMTSLQRQELWERTNRWSDEAVDVWFKSELKNGTPVGFGWSHEEPITDMMRSYITSYRDLPTNVYQFQTKLRNELRAKSGIMRGREFVMKDMYTYARNDAEHQQLYDGITAAYLRVFERVGLGEVTFVTFASGGAFTQYSHEFQTISDAGEDVLYRVPGGETFNAEVAPVQAVPAPDGGQPQPLQEVEGKGLIGVEPLAKFLGIPVALTTKTMLYVTDSGEVVAAAVRGGYNINEDKLKAIVGTASLKLADEATVRRVTGAEVGYAGLINLPADVQIVVDESCANRTNFEMGANRTNFHSTNVNWGRDLPEPEQFYDIKQAKRGDLHPGTGQVYDVVKAAEVGNIFSFGGSKSEQLGLTFTDEDGVVKPVILGSYGIGITRLMGVIVEHFSDERGLVWPEAVAPAGLHLVRLGDDEAVVAAADKLYAELTAAGHEVLYDDRDESAGTKFADADLMGVPLRATVSRKTVAEGAAELKRRAGGAEAELVKLGEVASRL